MLDFDFFYGGGDAGLRQAEGSSDMDKTQTYLCGLSDLLSDDLPFVGLVFLDGVQERGALLLSQRQGYV